MPRPHEDAWISQNDGPTGAAKSPVATKYPSSLTVIGSWGRGRTLEVHGQPDAMPSGRDVALGPAPSARVVGRQTRRRGDHPHPVAIVAEAGELVARGSRLVGAPSWLTTATPARA